MGRHTIRGMVLVAVPARRRPPLRTRVRLAVAGFGNGRRARLLLAALSALGLLLSSAGLYVVGGPHRAPATVPVAETDATSHAADRAALLAGATPATTESASASSSTDPPPPTSAGADPAAVSALAVGGIPAVALQAYQNAALLEAASNPACHLPWPLLAAIGRVESNHGRSSGDLLTDGTSAPPVMGLLLDGSNGFATIPDTDGGRLDGSAQFDRAIGPMQFIPSTWAMYAADGNGDGKADPFNIYDASLAAATYLCHAGGDLATTGGLQRAVYSYNHDQSYVDRVLSLANTYATQFNEGALPVLPVTGVPADPAATLPPATVGGPAPGAQPSDSTTASPTASAASPSGGTSAVPGSGSAADPGGSGSSGGGSDPSNSGSAQPTGGSSDAGSSGNGSPGTESSDSGSSSDGTGDTGSSGTGSSAGGSSADGSSSDGSLSSGRSVAANTTSLGASGGDDSAPTG